MELDDLCERLFDAFVAHDLDLVESMLAPGATITQNGHRATWAEARVALTGLLDVLRDHRYEDVRRVVGDRAVVEEHAVVAELPDGRPVRLHACVVVRVDNQGRITSLDEYADVSALG
jgi:ketosteroid isomerase-like protein